MKPSELLCGIAATLCLSLLPGLSPAQGVPEAGLASALSAAVVLNPAVRNKLAELRAQGLRVEEAQGARYPGLTLQVQSQSELAGNHGLARLQQPLYAFGRIDGAIGLAQQQEVLGRLGVLEVRRRLLEETAAAYVNLNGARTRLELAERNVQEHQRLSSLIQRRSEGGITSEADVRMAGSRLLQAKALRDQISGQVGKGESELFALTRQALQAREPVAIALAQLPPPDVLREQAENAVVAIRQRQQELELARLTAAQRKAELMPTVYARLEHDLLPSAGARSATRLGVVLEASVDGFGMVARPRLAAEAERVVAAQESLESARVEARRRLSSLLADRETQGQLVASNEASVQAVQDTLASFLRQYDAGRKSWVDVLNTQREVSDARQQLQTVRTGWLEASLRVAALLGRLDEPAGMAP
jgi:adhesin transport system outer membrane protein